MQISYEWISEYLPMTIEVDVLSEILTTIGLEVEHIEVKESVKGSLQGIVVGEVISCEQHPNADRLKKTQVKISDTETLDIVCGAPNVSQGQKVLVATVGTTIYPMTLPEGLTIKSSKIRGEVSEGMICAEDELGLGNSHDGIMVLDENAEIGTPASIYLQLPEPQCVFHIGLTPNRSDAMSHLGVASDVLAYWNYHKKTNLKLNVTENNNHKFTDSQLPIIHIDDADLCQRFSSVIIDDIEVGQSPDWLKRRLESIGVRSVNNIVDISNYVLHEIGQPIHIYDKAQIKGDTIIIQNSKTFSEVTTLDKTVVKLHPEDIVIADTEKVLSIAGVMGGESSSVQNETKTILIESAAFNPKWIRRTSIRHQMRTEAAIHFEKSTSIDKVDQALLRAVELIIDISGGKIISQLTDVYPDKQAKKTLEFSYDYIRTICGKNYSTQDINSILLNLGFEFVQEGQEKSTVSVPYNKTDITLPADIAEEILRIDGLNNVEISDNIHYTLRTKKTSHRKFINKISNYLSNNGFQEILTNSIVNSQNYNQEDVVKMMNSLSAELDCMRPDMCRSGLEVIEHNINRGIKNLMFYEVGNTYRIHQGNYLQTAKLAIWCTGNMYNKQWMTQEEKIDIYWVKGIIQNLMTHIGIKKYAVSEDNNNLLYKIGKETIASVQFLQKNVLTKSGIKQDVIYVEADIESLVKYSNQHTSYKTLNKFPIMERDLSIIITNEKKYSEIEKINSKIKSPILRNIRVFDIYEGDRIGENNKSWSMNYTFNAEDRTLTDVEVDDVMNNIMALYQNELQAEIRK